MTRLMGWVAALGVVGFGLLVLPDIAVAASAPPPMPQREQDLIGILMDARKQYQNGHTATAAQDARMGMQIRVISFMRQGQAVQDWVGTIKSHGVTPGGSAFITLEIADGITVSTWQNDQDDFNAATLFKPHTPLFQFSQGATIGETVLFSGTFQKSVLGSDEQMVTHPQFIARFSAIKAAP
jgi:hypothetical protein